MGWGKNLTIGVGALAAVFAAVAGYEYFTSEPENKTPPKPQAVAPVDEPVNGKTAVQKFGEYYKYTYRSGPRTDEPTILYSKEAPEDEGNLLDVEFMVDENGNTIKDDLPVVSRNQAIPLGIHEKTMFSHHIDKVKHEAEEHLYAPSGFDDGNFNTRPTERAIHKFRLERQAGETSGPAPGTREPDNVQDIIDKVADDATKTVLNSVSMGVPKFT